MPNKDPRVALLKRLQKIEEAHAQLAIIATRIRAQSETIADLIGLAKVYLRESSAAAATPPTPTAAVKRATTKRPAAAAKRATPKRTAVGARSAAATRRPTTRPRKPAATRAAAARRAPRSRSRASRS